MSTKENKILLIRKEIDTIKEYIEESQSEKRKLNEKLTELVRSVEKINSNNTVISLNLNGMKESLDKKLKFLDKEKEKLENSQMSKENMLEQLRTIANLSQTII